MSYLTKITFSVSLSLLAVVLFGLYRPKSKLSSFADDKFWIDKVYNSGCVNVVVAGDSRIYRGIDPVKLAEGLADTSVSILNYGFSSVGFSQKMLRKIEEKLDTTQKQKMIILGITPHSLTPQGCLNWHFNSLQNIHKVDVYLTSQIIPRYLSLFEPVAVTKFFKIIRHVGEQPYDSLHANGWNAGYKYPIEPTASLEPYKKIFLRNKVNPKLLDTLQNQIKEWKKKGIQVYAYRPPTTEDEDKLEDRESGFNETLTRQKIEEAGGGWLDIPDRFGYKSYDGSHLPADEASRLSLELGRLIRAKM